MGISLSKPSQPDFYINPEDLLIERENQKMLERRQNQKLETLVIKKDTSLDNPTPQMLAILEKIREKSISPPICQKRHHHNG